MDNGGILKKLIENIGGRFSVTLGIDLSSQDPEEIFKWFLASVLFGTRISERIVTKTYKEFGKERFLSDILPGQLCKSYGIKHR